MDRTTTFPSQNFLSIFFQFSTFLSLKNLHKFSFDPFTRSTFLSQKIAHHEIMSDWSVVEKQTEEKCCEQPQHESYFPCLHIFSLARCCFSSLSSALFCFLLENDVKTHKSFKLRSRQRSLRSKCLSLFFCSFLVSRFQFWNFSGWMETRSETKPCANSTNERKLLKKISV